MVGAALILLAGGLAYHFSGGTGTPVPALGEHTEPGSVGSYGWSGAAGTAFFVDPQEALFAMIMVQAPGQFDEQRRVG